MNGAQRATFPIVGLRSGNPRACIIARGRPLIVNFGRFRLPPHATHRIAHRYLLLIQTSAIRIGSESNKHLAETIPRCKCPRIIGNIVNGRERVHIIRTVLVSGISAGVRDCLSIHASGAVVSNRLHCANRILSPRRRAKIIVVLNRRREVIRIRHRFLHRLQR